MVFTIESLSTQLNTLNQQRVAAANMAQQCAGAISIIEQQILELKKHKEEELKKEAELKLQEGLENGETNSEGTQEAS